MRVIYARPLTRESFAPFGDVLEAPAERGRAYFDDGLGNGRPDARASLSLSRVEPAADRPLVARVMERHEFSSQSFVPLVVGRWLVIVAPPAADGGPDVAAARAFLVGPGQGVTFRMNTWHHPLTVLGQPATLAVLSGVTGRRRTSSSRGSIRSAWPSSEEGPMQQGHDRDLIGYAGDPPDPKWLRGARLALNFVINYEEGSEPSIPDGDGVYVAGFEDVWVCRRLDIARHWHATHPPGR